MCYRT